MAKSYSYVKLWTNQVSQTRAVNSASEVMKQLVTDDVIKWEIIFTCQNVLACLLGILSSMTLLYGLDSVLRLYLPTFVTKSDQSRQPWMWRNWWVRSRVQKRFPRQKFNSTSALNRNSKWRQRLAFLTICCHLFIGNFYFLSSDVERTIFSCFWVAWFFYICFCSRRKTDQFWMLYL